MIISVRKDGEKMIVYTVAILLTSCTSFINQYVEESNNTKIGPSFLHLL